MSDLGAIASNGLVVAMSAVTVVGGQHAPMAQVLDLTVGVTQVTDQGIADGLVVPSFVNNAGPLIGTVEIGVSAIIGEMDRPAQTIQGILSV